MEKEKIFSLNASLIVIDKVLFSFVVGKFVDEKGLPTEFDKPIALKMLKIAAEVKQDDFEGLEKTIFKGYKEFVFEALEKNDFSFYEKELNVLQEGEVFLEDDFVGLKKLLNKNPFLNEEFQYDWDRWFDRYIDNYAHLLWLKELEKQKEIEKQKNISTHAKATLDYLILEYEKLGVEYLLARYRAILEWENKKNQLIFRGIKFIKNLINKFFT